MLPVTPDQVQPVGSKILVRRYERPERVGSIWLNPAWLQDNSRSLWEPVAYGAGALRYFAKTLAFAHELRAVERLECLLVTPPARGVHVPLDAQKDHFFILAEEVVQVIPFEEENEDVAL